MQKHKQLYRHKPPESYGDCFRTVLGCLLNRPPQSVPHFYDGLDKHDDAEEANKAIKYWLASQGYISALFAYQDVSVDVILNIMGINNPTLYYIITGTSVTGNNHCCVGLGGKIIWDPAPEARGLVGPNSEGQVIIEILAPISQSSGWCPSRKTKRKNEYEIGYEITPELLRRKSLTTLGWQHPQWQD